MYCERIRFIYFLFLLVVIFYIIFDERRPAFGPPFISHLGAIHLHWSPPSALALHNACISIEVAACIWAPCVRRLLNDATVLASIHSAYTTNAATHQSPAPVLLWSGPKRRRSPWPWLNSPAPLKQLRTKERAVHFGPHGPLERLVRIMRESPRIIYIYALSVPLSVACGSLRSKKN